jgi:crossover junction endodeoxyribonuclease RuvC
MSGRPDEVTAKTPLVILGIDPGTRVTGWGVVTLHHGEPRGVACDVIAPDRRAPIEHRLREIFEALRAIIARYDPSAVAIEAPFVGDNVRSAMAVGEARTVAMLAAALADVPVHHYPPATVKQVVAGYGRGDKAQVREMLRLQLGIERLPDDLNATDALAVALCHATRLAADGLVDGAANRA